MTSRVFFINPKTGKSFYNTVGYIKKQEFSRVLESVKKLQKEN